MKIRLETSKGTQSIFYDERKKWEPINRQAAQVFRRASWEEMPPIPKPIRYLPSALEQAKAVADAASARYALLKAQCDEEDRQRAQQPKPKPKPKFATCKHHARNMLRSIHKRKGLPKPTVAEVHAFAKTLPMYGEKLHG